MASQISEANVSEPTSLEIRSSNEEPPKGSRDAIDGRSDRAIGSRRSIWLSIQKLWKRPVDQTWKATSWRWSPISGILCLVFLVAIIPAAAIILHSCEHAAVDDWSIAPNVWLVTLTGIGNKALGFAAIQGAVITWWLRAMHGSAVERLHRDWSHGPGPEIWSIITSGKRVGILAIATLSASVILVDGILLQRAIFVNQRPANIPIELALKIAPELPTNYTGMVNVISTDSSYWSAGENYMSSSFSEGFAKVQADFFKNASINVGSTGCRGTCAVELRAGAMATTNCSVLRNDILDMQLLKRSNGTQMPEVCKAVMQGSFIRGINDTKIPMCPNLIIESKLSIVAGREGMSLLFGAADERLAKTGVGNFSIKVCDLRPAVADYDTTVYENGTLILAANPPAFVAWANNTINVLNTEPDVAAVNSTLVGIDFASSLRYHEFSGIYWVRHKNGQLRFVSTGLGDFSNSIMMNPVEFYSQDLEFPRFEEPFDIITKAINELMFRASLQAAQSLSDDELRARVEDGLEVLTKISGLRIDPIPQYAVRWGFFWGAIAVQITCVILVAVTYWGYWTLGRAVSLSPVEVAKAFDAPAFRDVPSNLEASQKTETMKHQKLKYGAVADENQDAELESVRRRLTFEDPDRVYKPMDTFVFGP